MNKKLLLLVLFVLIFVFSIVMVLEGSTLMDTPACKLSDPPVCSFNAIIIPFLAHYFIFLFYVVSIPAIIIYWFIHRKEENSFGYVMEGIYGFFIALLSFAVLVVILIIWEIISLGVLNFKDMAGLIGNCVIMLILGILGIIKGYKIYKNTNKIRWKYATISNSIFIAITFSIFILFLRTTPSSGTVETTSYQVTCVTEVLFDIKSVCKSGNDYKISIKNNGYKDIVGWKGRLYEDESKIDFIDSDKEIKAFSGGQIIIIPSAISTIRQIIITPIIRIDEKDIVCTQNIDTYGDLEGEPITEECNK